MELYLLRHGIAEEREAPGARSDFERRLTAEGRERCVAAAAGLRALGVTFTHVWSSPLARAQETASLVLPETAAELADELAGGSVAMLLAALFKLPGQAKVLLVGHEPQLSETVEHLLGAGRRGYVVMKKAGLAAIEVDLERWPQEPASLHFLLTPKQLRALGGSETG